MSSTTVIGCVRSPPKFCPIPPRTEVHIHEQHNHLTRYTLNALTQNVYCSGYILYILNTDHYPYDFIDLWLVAKSTYSCFSIEYLVQGTPPGWIFYVAVQQAGVPLDTSHAATILPESNASIHLLRLPVNGRYFESESLSGTTWKRIATNLLLEDDDIIHLIVIKTPDDRPTTLFIDSIKVSSHSPIKY